MNDRKHGDLSMWEYLATGTGWPEWPTKQTYKETYRQLLCISPTAACAWKACMEGSSQSGQSFWRGFLVAVLGTLILNGSMAMIIRVL